MRGAAWLLGIALALAPGCGAQRIDRAEQGRRDALACVETRSAEGRDAARVAELCSRRAFSTHSERYRGAYSEALACVRDRGGAALEAVAGCRADG